MNTEMLHFGHFRAEKIEFEVGRSNFKIFENWQISIFFIGRIFDFETQSPIKMIFFIKYCIFLISSDKRRKDMEC